MYTSHQFMWQVLCYRMQALYQWLLGGFKKKDHCKQMSSFSFFFSQSLYYFEKFAIIHNIPICTLKQNLINQYQNVHLLWTFRVHLYSLSTFCSGCCSSTRRSFGHRLRVASWFFVPDHVVESNHVIGWGKSLSQNKTDTRDGSTKRLRSGREAIAPFIQHKGQYFLTCFQWAVGKITRKKWNCQL